MSRLLIGGAGLLVGLAVWVAWPKPPPIADHAERLARAWADGDVDTIHALSSASEKSHLSARQLNVLHDRIIVDRMKGIRLVRLTKGKVDHKRTMTHTQYYAVYIAGDGIEFGMIFTVFSNRESTWSGAVSDARMLATMHAWKLDGGAFMDARNKVNPVISAVLWSSGVRSWVSPDDGGIHDVKPPTGN